MILVALIGWQEPKYTAFITRIRKCYTARYESLWQEKEKKTQQENNGERNIFHATGRDSTVHY
jgi:hypothetical protein